MKAMRLFVSPLALLFLLVMVDVAEAQTGWITASPERSTDDPCAPGVSGMEGASAEWIRSVLIGRGHPASVVCATLQPDIDPEIFAGIQADLDDLATQVYVRQMILTEASGPPLDAEGLWGPARESLAKDVYLHLMEQVDASSTTPGP